MGLPGTLLQNVLPDAATSLPVLLDRRLRELTIAANRTAPSLRNSHTDGSEHAYWVDTEASFTIQEQTDLIQFLLLLDDYLEIFT